VSSSRGSTWVNFQDYAAMNGVYVTYFKAGRLPGRTCVGVTGLALGAPRRDRPHRQAVGRPPTPPPAENAAWKAIPTVEGKPHPVDEHPHAIT